MEQLFRDYWWLMFPLFGMLWALWDMVSSDRRQRAAMETLRFYAQQGKDPPPELIRIAFGGEDSIGMRAEFGVGDGDGPRTLRRSHSRVWTFIVFAALAAGFSVGWWWVRAEDFAFALLIVAVATGVMALGALAILLFGRKS